MKLLHLYLFGNFWVTQGLHVYISVGIPRHLKVPGLHAAFCPSLSITAQFCGVAGKYRMLSHCGLVGMTLLSCHAMILL